MRKDYRLINVNPIKKNPHCSEIPNLNFTTTRGVRRELIKKYNYSKNELKGLTPQQLYYVLGEELKALHK